MSSRRAILATGEYYHVFNRGVAKMEIFHNALDYKHFLQTLNYYSLDGLKPKFSAFMPISQKLDSSRRIIDLVAFCLMPNHFHFLLKQVKDKGISEFMSKLSNSYTKYINTKYKRVGPLFQGGFKAVHIESNEQLIHVCRYIHLNPSVNFITNNLDLYRWSSYNEYTKNVSGFCEKQIILNQFSTKDAYKQFVLDQQDYGKHLEEIKHLLIDFEA